MTSTSLERWWSPMLFGYGNVLPLLALAACLVGTAACALSLRSPERPRAASTAFTVAVIAALGGHGMFGGLTGWGCAALIAMVLAAAVLGAGAGRSRS